MMIFKNTALLFTNNTPEPELAVRMAIGDLYIWAISQGWTATIKEEGSSGSLMGILSPLPVQRGMTLQARDTEGKRIPCTITFPINLWGVIRINYSDSVMEEPVEEFRQLICKRIGSEDAVQVSTA